MKYLPFILLAFVGCNKKDVTYTPDPRPIFSKYQVVNVPELDFHKFECENTGYVISYQLWDGEITYRVMLNDNKEYHHICADNPFVYKEKELKAVEVKNGK